MADISVLKRIYRLHARLAQPDTLAAQKTWLENLFKASALATDGGSAEVTSTSFEGMAHSAQFRGSNAQERAEALMNAIEDITAEIAAADADEDPPLPCAALMPRVVCAPR